LGYCTKEEGAQKAEGTVGQYGKRTGWDQLTAVRENRIHMLFHDHSRNQFAFYPTLYMAKLFYPDVFASLDPDAVLKDFFDRFMLLDYEDGVWSAHPSLA
jgi:iron complex transport system substrate-binding protein